MEGWYGNRGRKGGGWNGREKWGQQDGCGCVVGVFSSGVASSSAWRLCRFRGGIACPSTIQELWGGMAWACIWLLEVSGRLRGAATPRKLDPGPGCGAPGAVRSPVFLSVLSALFGPSKKCRLGSSLPRCCGFGALRRRVWGGGVGGVTSVRIPSQANCRGLWKTVGLTLLPRRRSRPASRRRANKSLCIGKTWRIVCCGAG